MRAALDQARENLRGLQSIVDALADATPARAPARLAAALVLEEDLRELIERSEMDASGRDGVFRQLLVYRVNLGVLTNIRARTAGLAHRPRAYVLQREADEAHTRCIAALGCAAMLLLDTRRAFLDERPPIHARLLPS